MELLHNFFKYSLDREPEPRVHDINLLSIGSRVKF